ncbi:glycosyltransferase family 4 protein [Pseudooceanicola aestuarii]|uniref:glycosyltransferase family 4 protein n=1 Tax=Pseudooceanicola aestuarii TaxID=2697319 RepID=UPI0013D3E4F0|nr:glycosyltransferase family 1 protein [Pseudooceanicola aestuarii]
MQRFIFDVSDLRLHLARTSRISGIQRVSLMVIDHAARLVREGASGTGPAEVFLGFVDPATGGYVTLPYRPAPDGRDLDRNFTAQTGLVGQRALPSLEGLREGSGQYVSQLILRRWNAARGRRRHFEKRGTTLEEWRQAVSIRRTGPAAGQPLAPRAGDRLFVLGAFWDVPALAPELTRLKGAGMEVVTLIHDLIPLLMPGLVPADHWRRFRAALEGSIGFTTLYLANSDHTATDLRAHLGAAGVERPMITVPLAQAGLMAPESDDAASPPPAERGADRTADQLGRDAALAAVPGVSPAVRQLAKYPFVLFVGTWDIRKNLWRLARAWARLDADRTIEMPKLVLAGGKGWGNADFEALMTATGNLGGLVELIDHPGDAELDYLYRSCLFTIMPSLYEGWGLPIGESLGYGRTAVVAAVSSMPEVGGDMVEYCDPASTESLRAACARLITDPGHRAALELRIAETRLRGWQDVARDVLAAGA